MQSLQALRIDWFSNNTREIVLVEKEDVGTAIFTSDTQCVLVNAQLHELYSTSLVFLFKDSLNTRRSLGKLHEGKDMTPWISSKVKRFQFPLLLSQQPRGNLRDVATDPETST